MNPPPLNPFSHIMNLCWAPANIASAFNEQYRPTWNNMTAAITYIMMAYDEGVKDENSRANANAFMEKLVREVEKRNSTPKRHLMVPERREGALDINALSWTGLSKATGFRISDLKFWVNVGKLPPPVYRFKKYGSGQRKYAYFDQSHINACNEFYRTVTNQKAELKVVSSNSPSVVGPPHPALGTEELWCPRKK